MTIVSKFLDDAIDKCEELGYSKLTLSKGIVGTAVIAYVLRLTYPHIEKQIKYYKKKNRNKKNSRDTDDEDDEDEDGDNKEDDDLENGQFFTDDTANDDDDDSDDSDDSYDDSYDDSDDDSEDDNDGDDDPINCDNIILNDDNNNNNKVQKSNVFQLKFNKNKCRKQQKEKDEDQQMINRENVNGERGGKRQTNGKMEKKRNKNKKKTKVGGGGGVAEEVEKLLAAAKNSESSPAQQQKSTTQHSENQLLIGLNLEFFYQLKSLLKIMIPSFVCHETGLLAVHTICLISRTFLSIYVAAMEGAIVKFIVQKDIRRFAIMLLKWFGIAIPATFVNSMIRYLENKLALAFRTRLVHHSYKLYFKNQTYYRVSNLDGRIENADHRLTEDISTFSSSVAHLYSHLTKPCFDLMLIGLALMRTSRKMQANIFSGPLLGFTVISTTAHILRLVSPKFGQLVSEEANRYGYLRHIHSRIITNAEEIAFYGGHRVELLQLREAYTRLHQQMNLIFSQKLWFIMLEQFFMKYVWSGTGMIMVSLPILASKSTEPLNDFVSTNNSEIRIPGVVDGTATVHYSMETLKKDNFDVSERTQYLTTARNLLISGADAIERLMSSYKEIVALAGYTSRVAGMLKVFNETSNGIYCKNVVQQHLQLQQQQQQQQQQLSITNDDLPSATTSTTPPSNDVNYLKECNLVNNTAGILEFSTINGQPIAKGRIIYTVDYRISLKNVPVVTPNCDIVVQSLTLSIEPGMHLLITGPNGCGKSSLFRILSGLWPIYGGELYIPLPRKGKSCMFYIPQRPYLSIGSLREQIIYPDTIADMKKKKITETMLQDILKIVSLESIVARDKFDVVRDWKDILSGGEKQRMAIARLFYHKPKYALLDECTSAISIDVEHSIYESAKAAGITLLTITHRPTLWKFHTHILEFDGQGSWNFHPIYHHTETHINNNNNNHQQQQ